MNMLKNELNIEKYLIGNYMTALDMQGFSITLVPYDDEYHDAFDARQKMHIRIGDLSMDADLLTKLKI